MINARSLNNKLADFYQLLLENFSLIFITESWLKESVTNSMLDSTHGYSIYRKDRAYKQRGGGVIGLVSNRFQSHSIPLPAKFDAVEIVAFCLITASGNYRFIVVYRPPEFNKLGRDNMRLLKDCLMFLCNTKDFRHDFYHRRF